MAGGGEFPHPCSYGDVFMVAPWFQEAHQPPGLPVADDFEAINARLKQILEEKPA